MQGLLDALAQECLTALPEMEAATAAEGMLREAEASASRPQVCSCSVPCSSRSGTAGSSNMHVSAC